MKTILVLAFLFAAILIGAEIAVQVASVDPTMASQLMPAREVIDRLGLGAWQFGRPLIQLLVVLLILEWFLTRAGMRLDLRSLWTDWNIQTFIAFSVVGSYCIAVLADLPGVSALKEVVLIVIGFYFGSRSRRRAFPNRQTDPNDLHQPVKPSDLPASHQESSYSQPRRDASSPSNAVPPEERRGSSPSS